MTYYPRPKNPLREVLQAMTGSRPPKCVRGYSSTELSDKEQEELHTWAVNHVKPGWLTGIGLIDAADAQIAEAVSNGNIPPPEKQLVAAPEETKPEVEKSPADDDHALREDEELVSMKEDPERLLQVHIAKGRQRAAEGNNGDCVVRTNSIVQEKKEEE